MSDHPPHRIPRRFASLVPGHFQLDLSQTTDIDVAETQEGNAGEADAASSTDAAAGVVLGRAAATELDSLGVENTSLPPVILPTLEPERHLG